MTVRRGSVLIICIGLLMVLLALGLAFLARMRLSANESLQVVREAQARFMLQSACHYLMESSRLGWAPAITGMSDIDAESATLMECCGWTDVRDGSLGPRPVPLPARTLKPSWWAPTWPSYDSANPPVPPPVWWRYNEPYAIAPGAWDNPNSDTNLPATSSRTWPCPGSVVRVDAFRVTRPTYAVVPAYTLNPVVTPVALSPLSWTDPGSTSNLQADDPSQAAYMQKLFDPTFTSVIGQTNPPQQGTGMGALDPQPVASTWSTFAAGDATPVTTSQNLAWFRIYREVMADHDNNPSGSNDPDRVPLRGYNTFIIACGAGSSQGFRFWDASDSGYRPELEPVTASASGQFPSQGFFEQQRSVERILWFRVEWSGFQGGNVDSVYTSHPGGVGGNEGYGWNHEVLMYGRGSSENDKGVRNSNHLWLQHLNGIGHIAWIQRLDREPPRW